MAVGGSHRLKPMTPGRCASGKGPLAHRLRNLVRFLNIIYPRDVAQVLHGQTLRMLEKYTSRYQTQSVRVQII